MVISVPDDANPSPDRILVVRSGERWLAVPLSRVIQASAVHRLTQLPRAPKVWCGVTAWRGRVVPVLDLANLYGTEEPNAALVVLVILSGQIVGLRVAEVEGVRSAAEPGAEREILDLDKIDLPPLAARHAASEASAVARTETVSAPEARGLAMTIGGQAYWLPAAEVVEVLEAGSIIDVPWADPLIPAILPHGTDMLPLVRVDLLLGLEAAPGGPLVVARTQNRLIVFQIDEVSGITIGGTTRVLPLAGLLEPLPGGQLETAGLFLRTARTPEDAWLSFVLEQQPCLLPLHMVQSVAAGSRLAALPAGAPRALIGARAIGGRILPVVDQRHALGLSANEPSTVDIVVAPRDAPHFILAAQQIDGIVRLRPDMVRSTGGRTIIDGVVRLGERLAWTLVPAALAPTRQVAG
jgi:chemotaxis signal transduction protein